MGLFGEYNDDELAKASTPPGPWEPGIYPFTTLEAEAYDPQPEKGKPYGGFIVKCQFVDEATGKTKDIRNYLSHSPKAKEMNAKFMLALGLNPNEVDSVEQLVGLAGRAYLKIKANPTTGKKFNEVGYFEIPTAQAA